MVETDAERLDDVMADWVEKRRTYQFRPMTLEVRDVDWLIERAKQAQEAEDYIYGINESYQQEIESDERLRKENKQLREALERIAHGDTHTEHPHDIAGKALGWAE